jgi:uncharacterized protein YyaL (SSP411 family)
MESKYTNRLLHETSPYLLQHAHNPVDWYPWGEEALARAKKEDKPILLSIIDSLGSGSFSHTDRSFSTKSGWWLKFF